MGLLDDAIREHLDLKRRSGGDPTEIERMEREALGPVRREPAASVYTGVGDEPRGQVNAPAPPEDLRPGEHEPLPATPSFYEEPAGYPDDALPERDAPVHEEPPRKRRFLRGLSALSGAHAEEPAHDEHDPLPHEPSAHNPLPHDPLPHEPSAHNPLPHDPLPHDPLPHESRSHDEPSHDPLPPAPRAPQPTPPTPPAPAAPARPVPPRPAPPAPPHLTLSGEHVHEEPEAAAPAAPAGPSDEQATQVHRTVEPAAPEPAAPEEDEGDPLEETPEFLQDTPEHDRLWFEQRPPRDFDFDQ